MEAPQVEDDDKEEKIGAAGCVFSNSIKLMLERQKCTLYQQEMLLHRANITLYQHAVRKSKNHTLQAGYAAREVKIYTQTAGYAKITS